MLDNQFIHFFDDEPEDGSQPALLNISGSNYVTIPLTGQNSLGVVMENMRTGDKVTFPISGTPTNYAKINLGNLSSKGIASGDCLRIIGGAQIAHGREQVNGNPIEDHYDVIVDIGYLRAGKYSLQVYGSILGYAQTGGQGTTSVPTTGYMRVVDENDTVFGQAAIANSAVDGTITFELDSDAEEVYLSLYLTGEFTDWNNSFYEADIKYEIRNGSATKYSNAIKVIDAANEEVSFVEYWCDEDEFGIPFSVGHQYAILPLLIRNPQYKQSDEVYEKLNGEHVVLFSKSAKEYELVTEYLPEEWHDRIMLMLQCDHVVINGKSVYKSAEYTVDWEKYIDADNGEKLARATCKVIENVNNRNTN